MRLKPSPRHISTRNGNCSILHQRRLSFADSRRAGQNLPTEDWPQWPEPPPTHKVWHWTDWRVSLQHGTADSRPHTPDMPNVRCCPRPHLVITHKLGEETLRFTGGSSGSGCIHPRDWVKPSFFFFSVCVPP